MWVSGEFNFGAARLSSFPFPQLDQLPPQHFFDRFILRASATSPSPSGSTTVAPEAVTEAGAENGPPLAATPGGCARESCWFRLTMR